jgi:hypothetical protein
MTVTIQNGWLWLACPASEWVGGIVWAGEVEAGLYQINVTVPNLPDGDMPIVAATFANVQPCQDGSLLPGGICYLEWTQPIPTQMGVLLTIQN